MKKQRNNEGSEGNDGLLPKELKRGITQRDMNLSMKEKAKDALRKAGHDVPLTEDAIGSLSIKDRNLVHKERAKQSLRDQGFKVPETPAGDQVLRTQREINLSNKKAAKDALKK
jgi:hypothetical protein